MEKNQAIFNEIQRHLLEDAMPSFYFMRLYEAGELDDFPLFLLKKLKDTPQSPDHHPEGDVWIHTMLVVDEAAKVKGESLDPAAFMWAALLHDIGKPDCTKMRKGRLTAYDHDVKGEELAGEFLKVLGAGADLIRRVSSLVRWHMQILFVVKDNPKANVAAMKAAVDVREIALLGRCDRLGRKNANAALEEENLRQFLEKLR